MNIASPAALKNWMESEARPMMGRDAKAIETQFLGLGLLSAVYGCPVRTHVRPDTGVAFVLPDAG